MLAPGGEYVRSLAYGDGLFVAFASRVFSSNDGVKWRQRHLSVESGLNAIRYVNGSFWALGPNGTILQAPLTSRPRFRPETMRRLPDGTVSFVLDAEDSAGILIEAGPDLITWTVLTNLTAQTGVVQAEDADAAKFPYRFYRARLAP